MRLGLAAAFSAVLVLACGSPLCCAFGVCRSCEASSPDCCGHEQAPEPEPCDCASHDDDAITSHDGHAPVLAVPAVSFAAAAAPVSPHASAPRATERPVAAPEDARTLPRLL